LPALGWTNPTMISGSQSNLIRSDLLLAINLPNENASTMTGVQGLRSLLTETLGAFL